MLSWPYTLCHTCTSGASSTATTIPADDAEALANAVNDYEAAKKAQETHPAPPKPKPGIVRVNSVPVLTPVTPVTPVDKIRRTMTPTPVEAPPAVPAQPRPPVQVPPLAPATALSEETPDGSNPPTSGSRRVKKKGKKVKKAAKINTENTGTAAAASDQVRHEASLAPSHSGEATRPSEPHAPLESQPAPVQSEPTPQSAPVQPKPAPQSAPAQLKPAAKKARAKRPKRVHDNQPGNETTYAEMVKAQATPQGREALYREAAHEALQRLGTEQQLTPAETISPGSIRKPPAQEQQEAGPYDDDDDDDNATQHYEAQDDFEEAQDDFEEALDRAVKKEPTEAAAGCNPLVVVPEAQQQGAKQEGTQQQGAQQQGAQQQGAHQQGAQQQGAQQQGAQQQGAQQPAQQQGAQQPAQQPGAEQAETQQPGAEQAETQQLESNGRPRRQRREKTPAEKAAHARYMKFSRRFERTLTVYACSQPNDAKVVIEKHHRKKNAASLQCNFNNICFS